MTTRQKLIVAIYAVMSIGSFIAIAIDVPTWPIGILFIVLTFVFWALGPGESGGVVFINDEPPHNTDSPLCWCAPRVEQRDGVEVVIHKSIAELGGRVKFIGHDGC